MKLADNLNKSSKDNKMYNGNYNYDHKTVSGWQSSAIGVYYIGQVGANGSLIAHYVGKGTGDGGIKARLLAHLNQERWQDATHFGYTIFTNAQEAINFEAAEIRRLQPKYNTQGII